MNAKPRIYLDNAATSWPKPEAVYTAVDHYQREIGAPSGRSGYHEATAANRIVERSRQAVAERHPRELQRQARDECLSREWFRNRQEAVALIETWRRHYNEVRPHSSLDYLTPIEFKMRNAKTTTPPAEAASH